MFGVACDVLLTNDVINRLDRGDSVEVIFKTDGFPVLTSAVVSEDSVEVLSKTCEAVIDDSVVLVSKTAEFVCKLNPDTFMSETTGLDILVKVDSVALALKIGTDEVVSNESVALVCKSDEDGVTVDGFVRKDLVALPFKADEFNNDSVTFLLKAGDVSEELKIGRAVSKDSVALVLGKNVFSEDEVALSWETNEASEERIAVDLKTDEVVGEESGKSGLKIGRVIGEDLVIFVLKTVDVFRLLLQFSIWIVSVLEDASTKFLTCSLQK